MVSTVNNEIHECDVIAVVLDEKRQSALFTQLSQISSVGSSAASKSDTQVSLLTLYRSVINICHVFSSAVIH